MSDEFEELQSGLGKLLATTSRRQVLTVAGSTIVAAVLPSPVASAATAEVPPLDEGFFLVMPGRKSGGMGGEDPEADRVFFLSASWLPFFEVTDLLSQPTNVDISMNSPAVVSWTNHQLGANEKIRFSGALLPNPIFAGKIYKRGDEVVANTSFKLLDSDGNPVNTTEYGSGIATKIGRKSRVVDHFKTKGKKDNWLALYSDEVVDKLVANTAAPLKTLEPPDGQTYLAMSIGGLP